MDKEKTIKIIITVLISCGIVIGGYFAILNSTDNTDNSIKLNNQGMLVTDDEERAVNIADMYVKTMESFQKYNGKNLEMKSVLPAYCPGCWTVEFEFEAEIVKDITQIKKGTVEVVLNNWEVTNAVINMGEEL